MEQIVKHLTLEIQSNLGDVSLVAVAVHAICIYVGLGQDRASLVELSIVEAVTNSIKHACKGQPDHTLIMTISLGAEQLRFDLYDSGTPMPTDRVDRLVKGIGIVESDNSDFSAIPESGRGLEIIHRTMDKIAYTRESDRNHLELIIRLGSA
jgi:anti-sigma regulatory factor (Ser/Thr protein kinase)